MRPQAAHAIVKTGISWLLFASSFWLMTYVFRDANGASDALKFVEESRSEEPLRLLIPSAAVLIAAIGLSFVFVKQKDKRRHFKELCGEVLDSVASAFALISSAAFFLGFREPIELAAIFVAFPISFGIYWAAKELGA